MSRGISTRRAKRLRETVLSIRHARRSVIEHRLQRAKKDAAERVASLREQLTPEYRLMLSQRLAQWEAHVDALEDDGGYAITKGRE